MFNWIGLVSFVLWHINLHGLFNAKAILLAEQEYYLTNSWEDKVVYTLPKGIYLSGSERNSVTGFRSPSL